jgi:hypothetical protein
LAIPHKFTQGFNLTKVKISYCEKIRVCNLKNLYIVNFSLESTLTIIINIYTTNEIPIRMYLNTNANFAISKDINVIFYLNYVYCVNLKKRYIFTIMEFTIEDK